MLRISLSDINKSIKFSAFIATGILFILSLGQIVSNPSLFWEIVAGFSGLIFILLLASVLWRILKPFVKSWKKKKEKQKIKGKKGNIGDFFKRIFQDNPYFKIMSIIWFLVILVGLEIAIRFTGLIESEQSE